jgi:glycerol-3-phosphate dehydrogenase (NAD(P)+)
VTRVAVLGGGSWGTTVAALAATDADVILWARAVEVAREIDEQHTNTKYLGEFALPQRLRATGTMAEALDGADVIVMGVPSHGLRMAAREAAGSIAPGVPVVSLVKGLEAHTRLRPTQILAEELPEHPIGLLAGPNLAREVLAGYAAAAVCAFDDESIASRLQPIFTSRLFRVYRNFDVLGSELGGVLKNVIAIAIGMADGLGVGDNTRAMVITRGLSEMTRLAVAMGAEAETLSGLTGLGDLMATCMSKLSRNRRVGEELGKGRTIEEIVNEMRQVAEGVRTARSVMELAAENDVRMPISAEVDAVVNEGRTAFEAYRGLRRVAPEHEQHEVA